MSTVQRITSTQLKLAIRAKFAPPAFQTFFEVANDTGMRASVRADAVSIGIWPSSGHVIHGFEIKVSRGDWLREIANPGKSQPIFRHCDRWWLVCPAGLVEASELPKTWGMLTFHPRGDLLQGETATGSLRQAVKAPALSPEPITAGFMSAIIRRAGETDGELIAAAVAKAENAMRLRHNEQIQQHVAAALSRTRNDGEEHRKLGEKIHAVFGEGDRLYRYIDDQAFVGAVRTVMASGVYGSYGGLDHVAKTLRRQAEEIEKALAAAPSLEAAE